MMWAVDPVDDSCWLGGILIDQSYQRKGYGRQAVDRSRVKHQATSSSSVSRMRWANLSSYGRPVAWAKSNARRT
ncbi:MAG TPA: GNAT family N-acetyltransferase [Anaerolineae bacterium]|nr:GNAT family N-acetyltransferase [Anaerolineae bacterium]